MLVPGRSWCSSIHGVDTTAQFGVLGPFRRGQWIDRIEFGTAMGGSGDFTFGVVLGTGSTASVQAWVSGRPLVDRSTTVGDGQPVILQRTFGSMAASWTLHVGRRVTDGPTHMIWRLQRLTGAGLLHGYATVRVLEVAEEGSVNGA